MEKILLIGGSGFVGKALAEELRGDYLVIPTAGHRKPEKGYLLNAESFGGLAEILKNENPDIVISSIRGDFKAQTDFHRELANRLSENGKRLLYISTANVYDGDLSRPHTEDDPPAPESDYGIFKRDCEAMLYERLGDRLTVFRPASVWDRDSPRIRGLADDALSGKHHLTYSGDTVNITYAKQIGSYARYVLKNKLSGIFHVGTTDTVDYFEFEKTVCDTLGIEPPKFDVKKVGPAYQAVIPARKEIPDELQMTVEQVLEALNWGL